MTKSLLMISSKLQSKSWLVIFKDSLLVNEILNSKHLEVNVDKIFLLLLIKIKFTLKDGSSRIFNKAFIELTFKNSILSINTNLGLLLKEYLFKVIINSLIYLSPS